MVVVSRTDAYKILEISKDASKEEIKTAYKRLVLRCHPDKVAEHEKASATERFRQVHDAYELLLQGPGQVEHNVFRSAHKDEVGEARKDKARKDKARYQLKLKMRKPTIATLKWVIAYCRSVGLEEAELHVVLQTLKTLQGNHHEALLCAAKSGSSSKLWRTIQQARAAGLVDSDLEDAMRRLAELKASEAAAESHRHEELERIQKKREQSMEDMRKESKAWVKASMDVQAVRQLEVVEGPTAASRKNEKYIEGHQTDAMNRLKRALHSGTCQGLRNAIEAAESAKVPSSNKYLVKVRRRLKEVMEEQHLNRL